MANNICIVTYSLIEYERLIEPASNQLAANNKSKKNSKDKRNNIIYKIPKEPVASKGTKRRRKHNDGSNSGKGKSKKKDDEVETEEKKKERMT